VFFLENNIERFFLFYLENRFYFYLMLERILIMISILSRDIVSVSSGTLFRDNILIFTLEMMLKSFSYFILKMDFTSS